MADKQEHHRITERYYNDLEYQNGYDEGFEDAMYETETPKVTSVAEAEACIKRTNEWLKSKGFNELLKEERGYAFLEGYTDGFNDGLKRREEVGVI